MKKSILFLFCFLLIIFGLCGCNKEINKEINEESIKKLFESHSYYYRNKVVCDALNDVTAFEDGSFKYFSTKNKIYILNWKKKYSNEQNCKEVEIIDLDSDLVGYYRTEEGIGFETKESRYIKDGNSDIYTPYDNVYLEEGHRIGDSTYKRWFSSLGDSIIYDYYSLKKYSGFVSADNKIQAFKVKYDCVNECTETISYKDVTSSFEDDENVLLILRDIVKTNKAFYRIKSYKTNKEECDKYADVKCVYAFKLVKDDFFSDNYQYIKLYTGFSAIDIYNNYYEHLG